MRRLRENSDGGSYDLPPKYEDISGQQRDNDSFSRENNDNDDARYPPYNPPPYAEAIASSDQMRRWVLYYITSISTKL